MTASPRKSVIIGTIFILLLVFAIVGTGLFISSLINSLVDESPDASKTLFQVDSISFSLAKSSDFYTNPSTANWTIGISVTNRGSKRAASFHNVEVWVWYDVFGKFQWQSTRFRLLATAGVEDFSLAPKQQRNISGIHAAARLEFPVAGAIMDDIMDQGSVKFGVRVRFNVMYQDGDVISYVTSVARCPELELRLSPVQNTFTSDGSRHCSRGHSSEEVWG